MLARSIARRGLSVRFSRGFASVGDKVPAIELDFGFPPAKVPHPSPYMHNIPLTISSSGEHGGAAGWEEDHCGGSSRSFHTHVIPNPGAMPLTSTLSSSSRQRRQQCSRQRHSQQCSRQRRSQQCSNNAANSAVDNTGSNAVDNAASSAPSQAALMSLHRVEQVPGYLNAQDALKAKVIIHTAQLGSPYAKESNQPELSRETVDSSSKRSAPTSPKDQILTLCTLKLDLCRGSMRCSCTASTTAQSWM